MSDWIEPQDGFQTDFVKCKADILIAGSGAGVGKTFSLLLDPLRYVNTKGFGAVIFRRTMPQIRNEGGLWDSSSKIYPFIGGTPKESTAEWKFKNGNKFKFGQLEYDKTVLDWQGSEIPYIGFDELTHFSKYQFFYLLSRNRTTCGVKPKVRATCNPDPDSWVFHLIEWWIDEDGFPIPERQGVLRYLLVDGENYIWGDSADEVIQKARYLIDPILEASPDINPHDLVKSVTFIAGSIYDNKKLLGANPAYLANLLAQDEATKAALLESNWKAKRNENDLLDYDSFKSSFYESNLSGERFITADIAMKGSDKFILCVWDGYTIIDMSIMGKNNGKEVIELIEKFKRQYKIRNHQIVFDADGVGSFIDGFFQGSIPFNNGGKVINKENYENLKTQCFYNFADIVNSNHFAVSEMVSNKTYSKGKTVKDRMIEERKAIKRDKADMDGKLRIIPKDQMKVILNGTSPDILDNCAMRMIFKLKPKKHLSWNERSTII